MYKNLHSFNRAFFAKHLCTSFSHLAITYSIIFTLVLSIIQVLMALAMKYNIFSKQAS